MKTSYILFYLLLFSSQTFAIDTTGLEMSLAGDFIYSQGLNNSSDADDKLLMRGAELMFYAPIDHQFDGILSAAAHDEGGQSTFELHELTLSTSKLIDRSEIKVGQFFLGVGRLNHQHQHDWSFTRAPYYHETFFAKEGALDSGIEYLWNLPTERVWNLKFGITSGHKWGHSHTEGAKPKVPTHYTRLGTFFPFSRVDGIEVGLNYLGRKNAQATKSQLIGFDLTAKWREGKVVKNKFLHETWLQIQDANKSNNQKQIGGFFYYGHNVSEQWFTGARLDYYKDLDKLSALTGKKINNIIYTIAPDITYESSEFAKIRLTPSYQFNREEGKVIDEDARIELQFIFIIGSHPAHEF